MSRKHYNRHCSFIGNVIASLALLLFALFGCNQSLRSTKIKPHKRDCFKSWTSFRGRLSEEGALNTLEKIEYLSMATIF